MLKRDVPLPRLFRNGEFVILECRIDHCKSWGGLGICDSCGSVSVTGFLPMSLNWYLCPGCYYSWVDRAKWYEEDRWFQDGYIDDYLSFFNKLGICVTREDLVDAEGKRSGSSEEDNV